RDDEEGGRVQVVAVFGVPAVAEADSLREPADAGLVAAEKAPAEVGALAAVALEVAELGVERPLVGLGRIEPDRDDPELLAGRELHLAQGVDQAAELDAAEHRAVGVVEGQDDGL